MFEDKSHYPFLSILDENIAIVKMELTNAIEKNQLVKSIFYSENNDIDYYTEYWVKDNGFHPEQIGYDIRVGEYTTFPIFKLGFPNKILDIESLFPETLKLIHQIPGVYFSGFFKMSPNSELSPHTHTRKHLIYHILLNDELEGQSYIQCENEKKFLLKKGDTALFNYSKEHSSKNLSKNERINFVVDFLP